MLTMDLCLTHHSLTLISLNLRVGCHRIQKIWGGG